MSKLTSAQWLVLDNLKNGWSYWTNLDKELAESAYLWLVRNEYIKDGQLTDLGTTASLMHSIVKDSSHA